MEAINKNKEEIEKIGKERENQRKISKNLFGQNRVSQLNSSYEKENILESRFKERIKTSILLYEDEIGFLEDVKINADDTRIYERLKQLTIHLNWLKEQEKEL